MVVVHIISCTFDQARSQGGAGGQVHPLSSERGVQWRIWTHPIRHILTCGFLCVRRWHGNASTRKQLNTETEQKLYLRNFRFFRNSSKSLKSSELWRDFRIFRINFPIFRVEWFPLFWSISSLGLFPHIFHRFPKILDPFPQIFDPVPLFSKTLKISFCWSVSSNFRKLIKNLRKRI